MARKVIIGTVIVSLFSALLIGGFFQNSPGYQSPPGEYREGYLLVRFLETGTDPSAVAVRNSIMQTAGGGTIEKLYTLVPGLALVKLPTGTEVSILRS